MRWRVPLSLSALCLVGASALAQDVPNFQNPYALPKKSKAQPARQVDRALARALVARIEDCYQAEQQKPLSEEERQLLSEYEAELVLDLEPALEWTDCKIGSAVSPACLTDVAKLTCKALAEPVIDAGWDRYLTAEARGHVLSYARALAGREATCQDLVAEERDIVTGLRIDRLSVLIVSQIVTGRCELRAQHLADCSAELVSVPCATLAKANEAGRVYEYCQDLMPCRDVTSRQE